MNGPQSPLTSSNGKDRYEDTQESGSQQVELKDLQHHMDAIAEALNQVPPPTGKTTLADYTDLLAKARVRPTDTVEKPVACWAIGRDEAQITVGTLGNLSTITGKAKTKKTFAVTIAVAAVVSSQRILDRITGLLDPNVSTVLFFDTEQSRYHVLRIVNRICRLCGIDDPHNLIVYSLRPYSPEERLRSIDWALKNTPDIGLVVIDGIRDLAVDPVTDPVDASQIMTHLLQWTDQLNIHILTVLHQNKGDTNLRGHLGTELVNKSETVISITRDPNDKEISIVAPEYCRDKEFESFGFSVGEDGLPFLSDDVAGVDPTTRRNRKPTVDTMKPEEVCAIVRRAFLNDEHLRYNQLRTNVIEASEFIGIALAKSRAEEFIRRVEANGYLTKVKLAGQRYESYQINIEKLPF